MPSISQTTTIFFILALAASTVAAPMPIPDSDFIANDFTGAAGTSKGGSVEPIPPLGATHQGLVEELIGSKLLDVGSGNAGNAGPANSGAAMDGGQSTTTSGAGGSTFATNTGNKYTGVGGQSQGGNTTQDDALISVGSGNAGDGNSASSGSAGNWVLGTAKRPHGRRSRVIRINID